MKDPFVDIVYRRLCECPEDVAAKDPIGILIFITYQEAHTHPVLYARHLALRFLRRKFT